jgi:excisionase family DNA binding protein
MTTATEPKTETFNPMPEALLSVERLSAAWDVHPDSIKALIKAGALRASRVGRQLRIRPADAQAYLDSTLVVA